MYPYAMFTVVETCECPKIPETVVGSMPAPIKRLVCKCLNAMKTRFTR